MSDSKQQLGVSRRRFVATTGAVAASMALPVGAKAASSEKMLQPSWADLKVSSAVIRRAYLAEIARLAETLRTRFEAGDLRAFRAGDDQEYEYDAQPRVELEELCAAHFGLEVTKRKGAFGGEEYFADWEATHHVLAVSPHAESTLDMNNGCPHPAYHATDAVAWDLIAYARAQGWYIPTEDESEDPAIEEMCGTCGHWMSHHNLAGCGSDGDCNCVVRHVPHVPGRAA